MVFRYVISPIIYYFLLAIRSPTTQQQGHLELVITHNHTLLILHYILTFLIKLIPDYLYVQHNKLKILVCLSATSLSFFRLEYLTKICFLSP